MWPIVLLLIYCALVTVASLVGGWLPAVAPMTHTRRQVMMSLVAGLMLGVALLHLIPHAAAHLSLDATMLWSVIGLLVMFMMIRVLHVHQHGAIEEVFGDDPSHARHEAGGHGGDTHPDHAHPDHSHKPHAPHAGHGHAHGPHGAELATASHLSWMGLALGLALHTIIDGVAMAASVKADAEHGPEGVWLGIAVFVVVLLHKPLDALAITSLMTAAGSARGQIVAMNLAFALLCPLGALAFFFGLDIFAGGQAGIVGAALAFAAGVFLCLSLADILPEVSFHSHDRMALSASLLCGVALAFLIGLFEPEHLHGHSEGSGHSHTHAPEHDNHGHDSHSHSH